MTIKITVVEVDTVEEAIKVLSELRTVVENKEKKDTEIALMERIASVLERQAL